MLPLKTQSAIAIGKSIRDYEYRTDMGDDIRHIRHKLNKDIPRTNFDQDLLYSFDAFMTVCKKKGIMLKKEFNFY